MVGKKRGFIPDEKEAYIEIEIKELNGDNTTVQTQDAKVSHLIQKDMLKKLAD